MRDRDVETMSDNCISPATVSFGWAEIKRVSISLVKNVHVYEASSIYISCISNSGYNINGVSNKCLVLDGLNILSPISRL